MSKTVLLTGAAGFVGSHVARHMLQKGWTVVSLDRLDEAGDQGRLHPLKRAFPDRLHIAWHDLRSWINPVRFRCYGAFDYVVHLAAASHVTRSVADPVPFVLDNVLGTANLLEYVRQNHHGAKFLYFSTDEVMGPAPDGVVYDEYSAHTPNNPYAATKAAAEVLCPAWANTYGMKICVTHCTNIVGEEQYEEKFIPLVIGKINRGETVQIHAKEGVSSSRYYVHAHDVARAVVMVLELGGVIGSPTTGKYNISGDTEYTNLDVAQRIAERLGKPLRYELVDYVADRPRHDMRYSLASTRLEALGWKPRIGLDEILDRVIRSMTPRVELDPELDRPGKLGEMALELERLQFQLKHERLDHAETAELLEHVQDKLQRYERAS